MAWREIIKIKVEGGIVTNVGVFDDQQIPDWASSWIDSPEPGIAKGWIAGDAGTFSAPGVVPMDQARNRCNFRTAT